MLLLGNKYFHRWASYHSSSKQQQVIWAMERDVRRCEGERSYSLALSNCSSRIKLQPAPFLADSWTRVPSWQLTCLEMRPDKIYFCHLYHHRLHWLAKTNSITQPMHTLLLNMHSAVLWVCLYHLHLSCLSRDVPFKYHYYYYVVKIVFFLPKSHLFHTCIHGCLWEILSSTFSNWMTFNIDIK